MKIGRNDPCWCGSGRKYKQCHEAFDRKIEHCAHLGHIVPTHDMLKTPEQIAGIKESAKINVAVLDDIAEHIHVGIPSKDVILRDGDIINVDVSTIYKGYFSDSSRMFCLGNVSEENRKLVQVTKECVELGLAEVKPWGFLGDVGAAICEHARANGYTVVREIGGHGVGIEFHEEPWVGYNTRRGEEMLLVPGLMFTIEPMVNMGTQQIYTDQENGWEVYTMDGKPSAQWEYQVLVTENGAEVIAW